MHRRLNTSSRGATVIYAATSAHEKRARSQFRDEQAVTLPSAAGHEAAARERSGTLLV